MTHVKREFMGTCLLSVAQLALAGAFQLCCSGVLVLAAILPASFVWVLFFFSSFLSFSPLFPESHPRCRLTLN